MVQWHNKTYVVTANLYWHQVWRLPGKCWILKMKMARIVLSPWQRGPCLIFTWSLSLRPCSCENHSGNFPLGVVSFLTRTRTKISFFLIKILPLLRVLKVLLLHPRSKLSKLLSGTFVPFGVSYVEASGSHSERRKHSVRMSHRPLCEAGATYPAHTGAKVYRDETLSRNNPPFPKDRIRVGLVLEEIPLERQ